MKVPNPEDLLAQNRPSVRSQLNFTLLRCPAHAHVTFEHSHSEVTAVPARTPVRSRRNDAILLSLRPSPPLFPVGFLLSAAQTPAEISRAEGLKPPSSVKFRQVTTAAKQSASTIPPTLRGIPPQHGVLCALGTSKQQT